MMASPIAFAILMTLCFAYALVRGGSPERCVVAMYLSAYVATMSASEITRYSYTSVDMSLIAIDIILTFGLVYLALLANRYWILWAASLQIVGITAHFAKLVVPEILAPAYALTLIVWSYAALPTLVIGTHRHRQRMALHGSDASWS
jgi:hypothetical protein